MNECELINTCPFYNGQITDDTEQIEALKERYCRKNNLNCARFMVFMALDNESIPKDLLPQQKERAYEVISRG